MFLLFLSDYNENLNVSTNFSECSKYEISRKSAFWDINCFMQTGKGTSAQTDTNDEANSPFSQLVCKLP
jgi:hypothetical protein